MNQYPYYQLLSQLSVCDGCQKREFNGMTSDDKTKRGSVGPLDYVSGKELKSRFRETQQQTVQFKLISYIFIDLVPNSAVASAGLDVSLAIG